MPDAPPHHRADWRIDDGHAETVAPAGPGRGADGVWRIALAGASAGLASAGNDRLLGIDFGADHPPRDAWVRGSDLVAAWESGDDRGLVTTALWRRHAADELTGRTGVVAFEIVASATTRLLQADATLAVTSDVSADEVLAAAWVGAGPGAFDGRIDPRHGIHLVRRASGTSVLVAIHPADHQATTLTRRGDRVRLACWLFPAGVEKGVLLRSRVLAAVGPRAADLEWARDLATRFAALPPELST